MLISFLMISGYLRWWGDLAFQFILLLLRETLGNWRHGVHCCISFPTERFPSSSLRSSARRERWSKMALPWKIAQSRVTMASSASVEEARHRALELFRETCRALPKIMEIYNLDEVISRTGLRSKIAAQFRKHAEVTNPKVVDMLVFKGKEELENITEHAKQRHHLISTYVVGSTGMVSLKQLGIVDHGESQFLKNFYQSNLP